MCPTYDYCCKACNEMSIHLVSYDDRDTAEIRCEECDSACERRMSAPRVLKASYPDGVKRPGWEGMRIAAKLESLKANMDWKSDDAKAINKVPWEMPPAGRTIISACLFTTIMSSSS